MIGVFASIPKLLIFVVGFRRQDILCAAQAQRRLAAQDTQVEIQGHELAGV